MPQYTVVYQKCFFFHHLKGLKATNERQDNGTGVLYQVAQHPIDQVYELIYKVPMPLSAHTRTRETQYMAAEQVGLCTPLNRPPLAQRGN